MLEGVADVPRDDWNALVGDDTPFLEWEWLASLEEAGAVGEGTGWLARPLVAREGERLLAAVPLYVKSHSEGEFVFDWSWADAAQRAGIRYYPKLLVGAPFTPVTGARFLVAGGEDRVAWTRKLAEVLKSFCDDHELSGVHVNFCTKDEVDAIMNGDAADGDAARDFMLRVGLQYHWRNQDYGSFDDYLALFRSKRRNQIRRERREMDVQGVHIEALTGDDIPDDLFEPMFLCYLSTIESRHWGRQYLNRKFYDLLSERFRHRLCFVVARLGGEVIAGTTNVFKGDGMYGRYWGALKPTRHLHFNVCYYAAIDFCIERGIQRFEPGAGGDYKYLRGFDATPTWSLHYLSDVRLADAVSRFLDSERSEASAAIGHLRDQSALKTS